MHYSNMGYDITQDGNQIRFIYRSIRGPLIILAVAGGLALIAGVTTIFWLFSGLRGVDENAFAVAAVLGLLTLLCGVTTALTYRSYRARRNLSVEEATILVADLGSGSLCLPDGVVVSALSQVALVTQFDPFDSMQGFMRFLVLQWPGGSARVYKSGSRKELDRLVGQLQAAGLGVAAPPSVPAAG